jgi:tetratricopeptide (TPR) repeat protein
MFRIAFALLATLQSVVQPAPQDEVKDALAHAEALYYGARFSESIALLMRIDESLKAQPGRVQDKIDTKLRLALANIGLNDTAKAKTFLVELYALNIDYALDAAQFSPKVIAVAAEAKVEQTKILCVSAQDDARKYLNAGNSNAFLELDRSLKSRCTSLAAIEPEAAESFYKTGVAAYRRGEFPSALSSFEAAVTLSPQHELALQYVDLTRNKLQLNQDSLLLQWQRDFDSRQLSAAANDYRQILSSKAPGSAAAATKINGEYRKALTSLVETWNRTCPTGDAAAMNSIREQILTLLPDPSFGDDIRSQMKICPPPSEKIAATPKADDSAGFARSQPAGNADAASNGACIPMQTQLVLTRLKTRVDPVITNELRTYLKNNSQVVTRVKARISETGDVSVMGMTDGNPILNNAVRAAVTAWKFSPIRDQNGPRCVDTEIPITIKLSQ